METYITQVYGSIATGTPLIIQTVLTGQGLQFLIILVIMVGVILYIFNKFKN